MFIEAFDMWQCLGSDRLAECRSVLVHALPERDGCFTDVLNFANCTLDTIYEPSGVTVRTEFSFRRELQSSGMTRDCFLLWHELTQ